MNIIALSIGVGWRLGLVFLVTPVLAAPITVVDAHQQTIQLSHPAQRIVVLGPSVTELIFALGAGDQVVAVDTASDYPPAVATKQRVGSVSGLDLEIISALRPDVIIVWDSGYASIGLDRLARYIPVVYVEPRRLIDIATTLQLLGRLSGHNDTAAVLQAQFTRRVQALKSRFSEQRPLRGFYEVWHNPLMSIGQPHVINEVLQLCGVENIFSDSLLMVPRVNIETVISRQPQLVITASKTIDLAAQRYWQHWLGLKDNQFINIDPDLITRPSLRIVEGAEQLCQAVEKLRSQENR
ncbi:MAG: cobalamin-binding protein [Gammaproteobacteria bacterium]|nr:cobalamin-binding protein [Gammaproteobacteria bacterium]